METEKQRILILNRQYLFEVSKQGKWITKDVMPAPQNMRAGIHLLDQAVLFDGDGLYNGQVIFKDESLLYLKTAESFIKIPLIILSSNPNIGDILNIEIKNNRAVTVFPVD